MIILLREIFSKWAPRLSRLLKAPSRIRFAAWRAPRLSTALFRSGLPGPEVDPRASADIFFTASRAWVSPSRFLKIPPSSHMILASLSPRAGRPDTSLSQAPASPLSCCNTDLGPPADTAAAQMAAAVPPWRQKPGFRSGRSHPCGLAPCSPPAISPAANSPGTEVAPTRINLYSPHDVVRRGSNQQRPA